MKFEDSPAISGPSIAPRKRTHDPKLYACVDCGGPVRAGTKRCRDCYYRHIARGVDQRIAKHAPGVAEADAEFVRMDDKFCAAMKRAVEAGMEKPQ